ncbi:Outer envelope protein 80, chloroplastic, partial [Sarracenia purpurea var. burkii]
MPTNDGIRFTSSSIKIPLSPLDSHQSPPLFSNLQFTPQTLISSTLSRTKSSIDQLVKNFKAHRKIRPFLSRSSLLCSASLALIRPDEQETPGSSEVVVAQSKGGGQSAVAAPGREEERVLISEVFVRNKDGEELERKDLENEAIAALKACRPNSALTVREVQDDVHRIISSGYFCSCMPVAVDTRDGIRLVFQ